MQRINRHRTLFVLTLAVLSVVLVGTSNVGAASARATPAAPNLTAAAVAPGSIAVAAHWFTPGGRVYVALYDVWGAKLYETRWTTASATIYGREGGQDPAAGYLGGGAISERFDHLCGATLMARAYDEATERWSPWLDVDTTGFAVAHYGLNGSADPAQGYLPGC
jgi:hypothetical protein